ncbi:MAG: hypothetical protein ACLSE7_07165 [Lachnospirales bacterium]
MNQYACVRLKTGEAACIVEVLEDGKAYLADIGHDDGSTTTDFITHDEIESITG